MKPPTLPAGTRLGHYEVVEHVASGGMGDVYRAIDTRLGRPVALKVLSQRYAHHREMRVRFDREAHAVARLNHSHICTLLDVGHTEDRDFLVFEYAEGETLAQRLLDGPLVFPDLLRIAAEVLSALDPAHRNGVIHRDLKPTNILLNTSDASGRPEVMVKAFPPDAREWRVSMGGGSQPQWTRDGRELLFLALDGTLMSATFSSNSGFTLESVRSERKLPVSPFNPPFSSSYSVSADGTRVLANIPSERSRKFNIFVTANWTQLLNPGK